MMMIHARWLKINAPSTVTFACSGLTVWGLSSNQHLLRMTAFTERVDLWTCMMHIPSTLIFSEHVKVPLFIVDISFLNRLVLDNSAISYQENAQFDFFVSDFEAPFVELCSILSAFDFFLPSKMLHVMGSRSLGHSHSSTMLTGKIKFTKICC